MTPQDALNQATRLISKLIELGLSDDQTFPSLTSHPDYITELTIPGSHDFSISLKNINYREIYNSLEKGRSYNIKMIDGGLIQMLYKFKKNDLLSHRLCYFPSPDFEAFQNDPELYLSDEIYGDILKKNIVPFPIRFDYNSDPKLHIEIDHSKSHLTLGQYQNCRIPVNAPLTPYCFLSFILDSFYKCAANKNQLLERLPKLLFSGCLTEREQRVTHFELGA